MSTAADRGPYVEMLHTEIEEGVRELRRPAAGLFASAISAGIEVSISAFAIAVVLAASAPDESPLFVRLAIAVAYSLGFVLVVVARSELYTEHTSRAVLPVLSGDARIGQLLRLWGIVYVANLIAAAGAGWLLGKMGPALNLFEAEHAREMARPLFAHSWWALLLGSIVAGWLIGLVAWMTAASESVVARIVITVLTVGVIGFAHLPHCIAGTAEVALAAAMGKATAHEAAVFLVWATIGNTIGGALIVAALKYGHAVRDSGGAGEEEPT